MERRRPLSVFIASSDMFTVKAAAAALTAAVSLLLIVSTISPTSYLPFTRVGGFPQSKTSLFPEQSCDSRHQRTSYRKHPNPAPSPQLLSKLTEYERRHCRCRSLSESFTTDTQYYSAAGDCKFVVYTPSQGLGNRILGLSSTFLYALLTNRVLLVDFGSDMEGLFCEPFQNSTWLLPGNFPFKDDFYSSWFRDVHSYGNLLKKKDNSSNNTEELSSSLSLLLQIFLDDKYDDYDKLFFKDENQGFLQGIPLLVLISDGYFVPCLFQMQSFRNELERLFPDDEKETVFQHLGNYLFSPSNQAWGLITQFYDTYLAKAEERIGMQIRVFEPEITPIPLVMNQILSCIQKEKILLQPNNQYSKNQTSKAVLVASLSSKFYVEIKSTFDDEERRVGVYRASNEEMQQSSSNSHNMKAWMDMYLLSMSDVLMTSSMSTFGYVAAGIGGIRPWILTIPDQSKEQQDLVPEPACERGVNFDPCFHFPPWFAYPEDQQDTVVHGPVTRCEDVPWGLKLVNGGPNRTE